MPEELNQPNSNNEFSAQTYRESPLIYYSNTAGNPGIYLEWERYTPTGVDKYNILRSTHIDGPYDLIDTVEFPANEFVDPDGHPSYYYKIQELNSSDVILTTGQPFTGDELLLKSSLRYEVLDFLNVRIYDEEPIFYKNRTQAQVSFRYWNYDPRPEVRITSYSNNGDVASMVALSENESITKTINGPTDNYPDGLKIKLDYQGMIYFIDNNENPVELHAYDTVLVSYSVRLFTGSQMNEAMQMALHMINAQPGANKYPTIISAPYYYDPAIIYGATYFLLRSLLVGLNQREKRLLLQDPDNKDVDVINSLRETAKMYKDDFDKLLEKLPISQFPRIGTITVPEFNMPGGRSRFFRYIWGKSTS